MPVEYRYDSNIVVIEMIGEYSVQELSQTILNSIADSKCPAKPFMLIDISRSTSINNRSMQEIQSITQLIISLKSRIGNKIALVASKDLPYGLMRMSSVGSEERGFESYVFRDIKQAIQWLST